MVKDPGASLGAGALRPLNTPVSLAVETDASGYPVTVRRKRWTAPRRVVGVEDRWRIDDEWWREDPIVRLYYRVALEDGSLLTIYHDMHAEAWCEQREVS